MHSICRVAVGMCSKMTSAVLTVRSSRGAANLCVTLPQRVVDRCDKQHADNLKMHPYQDY